MITFPADGTPQPRTPDPGAPEPVHLEAQSRSCPRRRSWSRMASSVRGRRGLITTGGSSWPSSRSGSAQPGGARGPTPVTSCVRLGRTGSAGPHEPISTRNSTDLGAELDRSRTAGRVRQRSTGARPRHSVLARRGSGFVRRDGPLRSARSARPRRGGPATSRKEVPAVNEMP